MLKNALLLKQISTTVHKFATCVIQCFCKVKDNLKNYLTSAASLIMVLSRGDWMTDAERKALFYFFSRRANGLAEAIGKNCEAVVHDFEDPEHSIVAIANAHITG